MRTTLTFSAGAHYRVGAGLARIEGEIALRELFARFPNLCRSGRARRRPNRAIRGVLTLPVQGGGPLSG